MTKTILAVVALLLVAAAIAAPPIQEVTKLFVIDCGTLKGAGGVAFEIAEYRFVTKFVCPAPVPI